MNYENAPNLIAALKQGLSEEEITKKYGIDYKELYAVVSYVDQAFARETLKEYCSGCANDLCFCWPLREETPCLARGYEPLCPLK